MMSRYVLMGVSGCGKSSVGAALAEKCGINYIDGDDLHPAQNIAKMSRGEPLDDTDRAPWLTDVGRALARGEKPVVIGCSALKKKYRDTIRSEVPEPVKFIHLCAPREVLEKRVAEREGHFMPKSLLASQYADLEHLHDGELGTDIDISESFATVVADAARYVRETMT